jgi:hypothetical protein
MGAMLLGNGDGAAGAPMVSVTAGGRVHAVYCGTDAQIHYRLWNGKVWKEDELVASPAAKNFQPHVLVSPQGGVHVVFVGQTGAGSSSYAVFYSTRRAKTWSAAQRLSNVSFAQLPRLAIAPDGVIHVVYNRFGDVFQEIHYTRFDGAAWSAPEVIGSGFYPDLALDANGQPVVAWNDKAMLWYAQRDADGVWSAPQRIRAGEKPQTPTVVFDAAGGGHLVAQARDGDAQTLMYSQRVPGGKFAKAARVPVGNLVFVMYPRAALDCNGQLRVVYQGKSTSKEAWHVFQSIWNGAAWSAPERLDTLTGSTINQVPHIHANGNVVAVTWWTRRDPVQEIYADAQTIECAAPVSLSVELPKAAKKKTKLARKPAPKKPKPKAAARAKPKPKTGAQNKKR